jgi:hypothetical protein
MPPAGYENVSLDRSGTSSRTKRARWVNAKIIKQRCFNRKWGRSEGDFWYGLAISKTNIVGKN